MLTTTMRRIVVACAFLALLVPFVVTDSAFFPYIVGKAVTFRIIVSAMLGAWAVLALAEARYRPRWSAILASLAAFVAIVGLADAFGVDSARSFWSNFERMEGFVTIVFVGVYLLVLASALDERLWQRLFVASTVAASVMSVIALGDAAPDYPGQLVRVSATLGNPTYLAVYLLIGLFVAALMVYRSRANRLVAGAFCAAALVQVIALYYTGTRGAFVGLIVGLVVAAVVLLVKGAAYPGLRRAAAGLLALVLVIVGAFAVFRDATFIQDNPTLARIANISFVDDTVESRITLWSSIGWEAFKERPLLGWGQDNFIVAFGKHYDPIMYKQEPWFDRAHNVFVDWLMAGGILGALAYLALFVVALWSLWSRARLDLPEKALLTGLIVAYAGNNLFVFDNLVSYMGFAMVLAYIHAVSVPVETAQRETRSELTQRTLGLALIIAVLVSGVLVWYFAVRPFDRAQTLIDAIRTDYTTHNPALVQPLFESALSYGSITGLQEVREQLTQSAIRLFGNQNISPESRIAFAQRALNESLTAADAFPIDTRRLYFLALLLNGVGKPADARVVLEQALAINPTRQIFLTALGETYLAEQDYTNATDVYRRAYEVYDDNDTAFGNYAAVLVRAGNLATSDKLLTDRFGTTTIDNQMLFDTYGAAGLEERIAAILELRIELAKPREDAGLHASLAVVYAHLGRRTDAIRELERAIEIEPRFAAQGAEMIEAVKAGKSIEVR